MAAAPPPLDTPDLNTQLFSGFVEDAIAVIPDRLSLTLGTKIEHNYDTGFGLMPSVRLAWNLNPRHMLWTRLESWFDLGHGIAWNLSAAFVDRLPSLGVAAYTRVDSNLSWRVGEPLTFELAGQNLLQGSHLEIVDMWGDCSQARSGEAGMPN